MPRAIIVGSRARAIVGLPQSQMPPMAQAVQIQMVRTGKVGGTKGRTVRAKTRKIKVTKYSNKFGRTEVRLSTDLYATYDSSILPYRPPLISYSYHTNYHTNNRPYQ